IIGLKMDVGKMYVESSNVETYIEEKLKISFFDEDITEVYDKLSQDEQGIIDLANQIFQNIILHELLGNANYVSEAKTNDYNQFSKDLAWLKQFYNTYDQ